MKALLDFVPLVIFFILALTKDIFIATKALLITSAIIYSIHFVMQKWRLEKVQLITLSLTFALGGLTLLLHNDEWLRWKAPVLYWVFATAFLLSPFIGKKPIPLVKRMLGHVLELTDKIWKRLNLIWAAFFYLLGIINLIAAFTFAVSFPKLWIYMKVPGSMAIMMIFLAGQLFVLKDYFKDTESPN